MFRRVEITKPVAPGFRISSPFGAENDTPLRDAPHKGVDFACPVGTPLIACLDGTILLQRDHSDGNKAGTRLWLYNYEKDVRIGYFHMSAFLYEKTGHKVMRGELIGWSGNTGNSSGPHLHLQLESIKTGALCEPIFIDGDN